MNHRTVLRVLGFMWIVIGGIMLPSISLAIWDRDGSLLPFVGAALLPCWPGWVSFCRREANFRCTCETASPSPPSAG